MNTIELEVQGMSCGSCVAHVQQALRRIAGVGNVAVDLDAGRVRVSGDLPDGAAPLVTALAGAGYPARESSGSQPGIADRGARGGGCCR